MSCICPCVSCRLYLHLSIVSPLVMALYVYRSFVSCVCLVSTMCILSCVYPVDCISTCHGLVCLSVSLYQVYVLYLPRVSCRVCTLSSVYLVDYISTCHGLVCLSVCIELYVLYLPCVSCRVYVPLPWAVRCNLTRE